MVATIGTVAVLFAAMATLAVAGFVVVLDFGQRVHRAFALFLLFRALVDGFLFFGTTIQDLAGRLRVYGFIAVPFAALHFALAYRRRHGRQGTTRPAWAGPIAILACAMVLEFAYLLDHAMFGNPTHPGPLIAFIFLPWPTDAGIALLFALEQRRTGAAAGRKALFLAAFGISLSPLYYSGFELARAVVDVVRGTALTEFAPFEIAEGISNLVTLMLLAAVGRILFLNGRAVRLFVGTWIVVIASVVGTVLVYVLAPGSHGNTVTDMVQVVLAFWSLAVPICVTLALIRYRLFDAEVRLRFAIKGTSLAAVFLAVFFVVSQLIQNATSQTLGVVGGAVAAGLLLFAINPLQRAADRLAHKAVPGSAPLGHLSHPERVQMYREQLEIAWADGRLTS